MDIARPSQLKQMRRRQIAVVGVSLLVLAAMSFGLSRLQPALPTVEAATLYPDTVKRGPMVRQVRGIGTLVPEGIRWIPATTEGRVERIVLRPGTAVSADSVVLELSNPQLDQEVEDAQLKLQAAEAALANLRVQVQNDLLQQKAATASIDAEYSKARMQAEMNEALARERLVSDLALRQSALDAEQLSVRRDIAVEQLATRAESSRAQLAVQQSSVDQARALLQLRQRQRAELHVRAGLDGILQLVPVDEGQRVAPGTNLARVANPGRLKAEIKIAETQAKDVQLGQRADVDTRNGVISGRVTRIDPSVQNGTRTVDVSLDGELPRGAVPDLSVDGTIELERLADVVFMGRPAFGQDQSIVGIFKVDPATGEAHRVRVQLGRSSVDSVEVLSGLSPGDKVILSDMSAWDSVDRVRLK
jgi:HlyD family secretion protein